MSFGMKDAGEEYWLRNTYTNDVTQPTSLDIGMYNDATDSLNDVNNLGAINTEPTGSKYKRQSVDFGTEMAVMVDSDSNWLVEMDDVKFDVSDSSQTVDGVFVVVNYQRKGENQSKDQLFFTTPLSQSTNLGEINGGFTLQGVGHSVN